jgi:hypothetical protein
VPWPGVYYARQEDNRIKISVKNCVLLYGALLVPSLAWTGPIVVSGGGTFYNGLNGEHGFTVSFGGFDGERSVFVSVTSGGFYNSDSIFGPQFLNFGEAEIDGLGFASQLFDFGVGNGGGVINGYDSHGNVVITEDLSGYIQQTSIQCDMEHDCQGTFNVITNPEPQTLRLALLSAGAFVAVKAARRRRPCM